MLLLVLLLTEFASGLRCVKLPVAAKRAHYMNTMMSHVVAIHLVVFFIALASIDSYISGDLLNFVQTLILCTRHVDSS
jgi:hypothetical protein